MKKGGKKTADFPKVEKKKKLEKPIMIGDVNIAPLTNKELINFNNELINEITTSRKINTETIREMNVIKTCLENYREKIEKKISEKILTLQYFEIEDEDIKDKIKAIEIEKTIKNEEESNVNRQKQLKGRRSIIIQDLSKKLDNENEVTKVKTRSESYKTELIKYRKQYEDDVALYHQTKRTPEYYKKIFAIELFNQRKHSEYLRAKRINILGEFLKYRFIGTTQETDIFWSKMKNLKTRLLHEQLLTDKHYFRRLIHYENNLRQSCIKFANKIIEAEKEIKDYENTIALHKIKEKAVENEMKLLRRKAYIIIAKSKTGNLLKYKIQEVNYENKINEKEMKLSKKKYYNIKNSIYNKCISVDNGIDELATWKFCKQPDLENNLKKLLYDLSKLISGRLNDILGNFKDECKEIIISSLKNYPGSSDKFASEAHLVANLYIKLVDYLEIHLLENQIFNEIPFMKY